MSTAATDTRAKLIESARDLFMIQGYHSTGISQILKRAEVNSGSLYYFFPTKEDLLLAVLEWYRDHIEDDLLAIHTAHVSDPVEKIFALLDGYRQMLHMFEFEMGCPIGNLALEVTNTHPAVRSLLLVNFEQWVDSVEGFLNEAADRFPEDLDRRALAVHILATMEGGVMLARTYRSLRVFDNAVNQLRDYIERLLIIGSTWSAPKSATKIEESI
ncbi:MAG: TetR/AcrR family transcriptional regulator [Fimbriimonadaceae bacterium]|nr:TetR/AcrR family transcriptional regulator [Fimbriimonadaceae bacterium]